MGSDPVDNQPPRSLAPLAAPVVAALVLLLLLNQFQWALLAFLRPILPAFVAAIEAIACIGASRGLRRLVSGSRSPLDAAGLAADLVLGLPLFGTLCFLAGLASTGAWVQGLLLFAGLLHGAWQLLSARRESAGAAVLRRPLRPGPAGMAAIAVLGVAVLLVLGVASLPPFLLDEVAYHLAVVRTWVLEGHVVELPLLSHSYFPFGVESADLPLLALLGPDGGAPSHVLRLAVAVAGGVVLVSWLRDRTDDDAALVALAAVATPPALLATAGASWVDAPLVAIALTLAVAVDRWQRSDPRGSLAGVGIAVAAGCLTKYSFPPLALAVFAAGALAARADRRAVLRLFLAFAAGGVAGSVFLVRNVAWTGNPVAPFLGPYAPDIAWFNRASDGLDLVLRYLADPRMWDESIGVAALALALMAPVAWSSLEPFLRALWLSTALAVAVIAVGGPTARVFLPYLALACVAGTVAAARALRPASLARTAVFVLVLAACGVQVLAGLQSFMAWRPFGVFRVQADGTVTSGDAEWLRERYPELAAVDVVNRLVPEGSRVLALGIQQTFWFARPVRGGGNFDGPRIAAFLDAPDEAALHDRLRADGLTHVAIFPRLLRVGDADRPVERMTTLPEATGRRLASMLRRYGDPLFTSEDLELWTLH